MDLLKKMELIHEAFYNNQFNRDNQLLGIIKERDTKQEEQTKEIVKGFKSIYISPGKDLEKKMEGRDKVLDDNDAYRRKMWLENLDLINNNLSKFLEVMTEMERNVNTLGMRQDELNKKVDLTNELTQEKQTDKEKARGKRRIEVKIPEFSPRLDTLDLDPPDIYTHKQKRKNRPIHSIFNHSFPYCCSKPLQQIINKIRKLLVIVEFNCVACFSC